MSELWRLGDLRHADDVPAQSATYFCHPQPWTEEAEMLPAEVKVVGEGALGLGCSGYAVIWGQTLVTASRDSWGPCAWRAAPRNCLCGEGTKHPSPCGAAARGLIWALQSKGCACLYVYQKLSFLYSGLTHTAPSKQMELQLLYPSVMVCASCASIDLCIESSLKAMRISQVY